MLTSRLGFPYSNMKWYNVGYTTNGCGFWGLLTCRNLKTKETQGTGHFLPILGMHEKRTYGWTDTPTNRDA